ncbi:MAG: hypothetical protein INR71_13555, partial [Terriglobus roseus]|nr:hypothetical protein [Terriglobus roseus]
MSPWRPGFITPEGPFARPDGRLSRSSSTRRRRGDAETSSIASRLTNRFASLHRPWRQRKPSLSVATGYSTPAHASSRSSSLSSGTLAALEHQASLLDSFAPSPIDSTAPVAIPMSVEQLPCYAVDPIDREALASTPLLPPMIDEAKPAETPFQSPLQSPTVAASNASLSFMASPIEATHLQALKTPPLSTKPSIASFHQVHAATLPSPIEVPRLMMADPNDPWTIKLGHANFTINPEPYLPEVFTAQSVADVFGDWERARCNFTKHLHRTGEHFGVTSKTYQLTEEKWAEIDAQWKANYDRTVSEVPREDAHALPDIPDEPAPLMKVPTLNDPK